MSKIILVSVVVGVLVIGLIVGMDITGRAVENKDWFCFNAGSWKPYVQVNGKYHRGDVATSSCNDYCASLDGHSEGKMSCAGHSDCKDTSVGMCDSWRHCVCSKDGKIDSASTEIVETDFAIDAWGYKGWGDCSNQYGTRAQLSEFCKAKGYSGVVDGDACYHEWTSERWRWTGAVPMEKGELTRAGLALTKVRCLSPETSLSWSITLNSDGSYESLPEEPTFAAGDTIKVSVENKLGDKLRDLFAIRDMNRNGVYLEELCEGRCPENFEFNLDTSDTWWGEYNFMYWYRYGESPSMKAVEIKFFIENSDVNIDYGECEVIEKQGDPKDKLDIVFVANDYNESNIDYFESDVDNLIKNGLNENSFYKNNWDNLNFYRVKRLGDLVPEGHKEAGSPYPGPSYFLPSVVKCSGYDIVIVLRGENPTGDAGAVAWPTDTPPWSSLWRGMPPATLVHESGHLLANLADEYPNYGALLSERTLNRPNIDQKGCPKWCSGEIRTGEQEVVNPFMGHTFNLDCAKSISEIEECYGEIDRADRADCVVEARDGDNDPQYCDIGVGCEEGTGCYWHARGSNAYRASKVSIMWGTQSALDLEFNKVSEEAMLEALSQYVPCADQGNEFETKEKCADVTGENWDFCGAGTDFVNQYACVDNRCQLRSNRNCASYGKKCVNGACI